MKKEDREAEKRLGKKTGYFNSKPWTFYGQGVDRRICQECSGICCNALKDLVGRLVEKGFLIPGAHSPTVGCCCLVVGFELFTLQDYSNAIRRIIWRLECWRIGMCLYSFI